MKPIVTLTLNPAIDVACDADVVRPTQKTRTYHEQMEPGGGGINVARALCGFAAPVKAIYLAGGASGRVLDAMVAERGIAREAVWAKGDTRISLNVRERGSGLEYRFVPEGPEISEFEWRDVLARVKSTDCDYFIASGSLPRGVPDDFYPRVIDLIAARGARFLLDTSGAELKSALRAGVFLIKPSLAELEELVGQKLENRKAIAAAAISLIENGRTRLAAVTLGQGGSILAGRHGAFFLPAVDVQVRSTVGAGDSFLAGMAYGLASANDDLAAFRMAVAAGAAAVQSPGADLCKTADVDILLKRVGEPQRIEW
ncbi:MAG TPA: 1-phosphofructokinase family hexose kinase [Sphingomicrobium sp.]|nr:1-phosphofructokinase family hexose kinase [Sphingomicrobium sp.]